MTGSTRLAHYLNLTLLLGLMMAPVQATPPHPAPPTKKQAQPSPPRLKPLPKNLQVPIEEPFVIEWLGGGKVLPKILQGDTESLEVEVKPGHCRLIARQKCDVTVVLDWGKKGPRWTIPISFRPPAGRIPNRIDLNLTGSQDVSEALRHLLLARVVPHSTLEFTVETAPPPVVAPKAPPPKGGLRARIAVSAPNYLTIQKTVPLQIERQDMPGQGARTLYLSNRPEKLARPGILFERPWSGEAPCRWLFHHKSVAPADSPDLWLELRCRNRATTTASFNLVLSALGPARDEIYVGHLATQRFLQKIVGDSLSGWLVKVPPESEIVLERLRLKSGQTVSGLALLTPKAPLQVDLRVVACQLDGSESELTVPESGPPGRTARGVFAAEIEQKVEYASGQRYQFIQLGAPPYLADLDPAREEKSPGNFGAVYRYNLQISNPGQDFQDFSVAVSARGGPARGHFYIDGALKDPGNIGANPQELQRWRLGPGETRSVYMETFPQSGSNYPVSLVVGSVRSKQQEPSDVPPSAKLPPQRMIP